MTKNLMKTVNCRVIPVADYVMNVCSLGKGDLNKVEIVKIVLREKDFMEDNQAMRNYI